MSKRLFLCQVKPHNEYLKAFEDRNEATRWFASNYDSAGERSVKKVIWENLPDAAGFKETREFATEEEKEVSNVVDLKLVGGGNTPDGDWLSPMLDGSVFLVNSKQKPLEYILGLFRLVSRTERSVILQSPAAPGQNIYVCPLQFCRVYSLYEDLGRLITEEQQETMEEIHDDNRPQGE